MLTETVRVPRTTNELFDRVEAAQEWLAIANLSGSNEAYQKAAEAQRGLYYSYDNKHPKKIANKVNTNSCFDTVAKRMKRVAYLDRDTGVLTVHRKQVHHYRIGMELRSSNTNTNHKIGWYCWDGKRKKVKELHSDIIFFDLNNNHVIKYPNIEKRYLVAEKYPTDSKNTSLPIQVRQINSLTSSEMKGFLKSISIPERLPLFEISKETINKQLIDHQFESNSNSHELHPLLKTWQEGAVIDPTVERITFDPKNLNGNIYFFGNHREIPLHGVDDSQGNRNNEAYYGSDNRVNGYYTANYNRPTLKGYDQKYHKAFMQLKTEDLHNMGFIEDKKFLSNAFVENLVIPGDPKTYPSVAHYLFEKSIEKAKEWAKTSRGSGRLGAVKGLERQIKGCKTPQQIEYFYNYQIDTFPTLDKRIHSHMFYGLDNELKKALFYKFTDQGGQPNELGKKLLSTGHCQLYAGYEIGDPNYGMRFLNYDAKTQERSMEGVNKLGKALMELRGILREQQNNRLNVFYEPVVQTASKPLPIPKAKTVFSNGIQIDYTNEDGKEII